MAMDLAKGVLLIYFRGTRGKVIVEIRILLELYINTANANHSEFQYWSVKIGIVLLAVGDILVQA